MVGRVCPQIFPLQRPHETQQAEETAEDRAFIQQIRGSKLMENLASFQEISHKSYLLRISLLFFFLNVSYVFVHVGTCIHFKGIFTLIQVMVNESCSSSRDLCLQPWVQLCMYYNASWSKLIHILILLVRLYMMGIWFEISLYPCNSYSPTVWKFWKVKMFLRVLENIWKKKCWPWV